PSAAPRAGDCIAGTLIAVIAAASDSTASAFCDLVFCRSDTITAISVSVTTNALTICATATNVCKSIRPAPCQEKRGKRSHYFCRIPYFLLLDPLQRSRLKIQVAFCFGIRNASHLSAVVNRICPTITFQSILHRYSQRWWSIQPPGKRRKPF